jgi:hypothetical protein
VLATLKAHSQALESVALPSIVVFTALASETPRSTTSSTMRCTLCRARIKFQVNGELRHAWGPVQSDILVLGG